MHEDVLARLRDWIASLNKREERHYQLQALRADTTGFMMVVGVVDPLAIRI